MNNHKHARLTRLGRALLVNRVMQQNWTILRARRGDIVPNFAIRARPVRAATILSSHERYII
nr:leucine zipper domain-containing protein [Bordetella pertussis]